MDVRGWCRRMNRSCADLRIVDNLSLGTLPMPKNKSGADPQPSRFAGFLCAMDTPCPGKMDEEDPRDGCNRPGTRTTLRKQDRHARVYRSVLRNYR